MTITVNDLLELYDDWNNKVRINYVVDGIWRILAEDFISVIMAKEKELIQREVMAFGFHDGGGAYGIISISVYSYKWCFRIREK